MTSRQRHHDVRSSMLLRSLFYIACLASRCEPLIAMSASAG